MILTDDGFNGDAIEIYQIKDIHGAQGLRKMVGEQTTLKARSTTHCKD